MHIINRACSQIPNTGATVFACNSTSDLQMHLFCIPLHQRKVQTPGGVRLFFLSLFATAFAIAYYYVDGPK
jgi:hypothetical protein